MTTLNVEEVLNRFDRYLGEMNLANAFEAMVEDAENEQFTDDEIKEMSEEIIIPTIIVMFAEKYSQMDNCYDYSPDADNLISIFQDLLCLQQNR